MFIGHYAMALAAKKVAPRLSLGTLFLSVQLPDLLWPVFLLFGLEHVRIDPGNTAFTPFDFYDYPWSHSLVGVLVLGLVMGMVYFGFRRSLAGAGILGAGVVSHWVLDAITHRPDLPLYPGGAARIGLGLWNSLLGTVVVELGVFVMAAVLYARLTTPRDKVGHFGFLALIFVLGLIWIGNVTAPPPPSEAAVAWATLGLWLFVAWGYWLDRHRQATEPTAGGGSGD
jgi:hypothetical protein